MSKKYIITHYIRQSPDEIGWMPLPFITQIVGDSNQNLYFLAYNDTVPISYEVIEENVEQNYYKALQSPIITDDSQFLWLSPSNDIWLGLKENPFNGYKQLIETEFSVSEIKSKILEEQLREVDIDINCLADSGLPLQLKRSLKILIKKLSEDPSISEKLKTPELSIIDPTYIQKLNFSIKKLKLKIKELEIGSLNDPTGEQVFEATENKVYYKIPTLFLYPYFLDENRIGDNEAGVIQYGVQSSVAIVIHKENDKFLEWAAIRDEIKEEFRSSDNKKYSNHELDRGIQPSRSINWLKELLEYLYTKSNSEIHSVRGYVFHSIIQQFADIHIKDNKRMGEILKISTDTENFSKPDAKLPFYREVKGTENLNHNQILLLDPADAFLLSQNGQRTFNKLWRDYEIVYVNHGLDIPVGIGYSLYALPKLLKDGNWKIFKDILLKEFQQHKTELRSIGISIDDLVESSTKHHIKVNNL